MILIALFVSQFSFCLSSLAVNLEYQSKSCLEDLAKVFTSDKSSDPSLDSKSGSVPSCQEYIAKVSTKDPLFDRVRVAVGSESTAETIQLRRQLMHQTRLYLNEQLALGSGNLSIKELNPTELERIAVLISRYATEGGNSGLALLKSICDADSPNDLEVRAGLRKTCLSIIDKNIQAVGKAEKSDHSEKAFSLWDGFRRWASTLPSVAEQSQSHENDEFLTLQSILENPEIMLELESEGDKIAPCTTQPARKLVKDFQDWKSFFLTKNTADLRNSDRIPVGPPLPSLSWMRNTKLARLIRKGFCPLNKAVQIKEDAAVKPKTYSFPYLHGRTDVEPPPLTDSEFGQNLRTKIQTLDPEVGPDGKLRPILLNAVWRPGNPREPSTRGPTVILFHGQGNTADNIEYLHTFYAERGINTLAITLRGYQGSGGDIIDGAELGMQLDGEAAVRFALQKLKIPKNLLFVHGHSLGGSTAAPTAKNFGLVSVADRTYSSAANVSKRIVDGISQGRGSRLRAPKFIADTAIKIAYAKNIRYPLPPGHFSGKEFLVSGNLNNLENFQQAEKPTFFIYGKLDKVSPPEDRDRFIAAKYPRQPSESQLDWEKRVEQYSGDNDLEPFIQKYVEKNKVIPQHQYLREGVPVTHEEAALDPDHSYYLVPADDGHCSEYRNPETVKKLERFLNRLGLLPIKKD